jgi:hypothetical protein
MRRRRQFVSLKYISGSHLSHEAICWSAENAYENASLQSTIHLEAVLLLEELNL